MPPTSLSNLDQITRHASSGTYNYTEPFNGNRLAFMGDPGYVVASSKGTTNEQLLMVSDALFFGSLKSIL